MSVFSGQTKKSKLKEEYKKKLGGATISCEVVFKAEPITGTQHHFW